MNNSTSAAFHQSPPPSLVCNWAQGCNMMFVIFYLGLISAQSACNIRIIYSEKTIGLLRIKMDVFFSVGS